MTVHQSLLLVAGFGWWPIATVVLAGACVLAHWAYRDATAWRGLAALAGASAAVVLLRGLVMHVPEPFAAMGLLWPSGHSALAAVVYGSIGFVYGRHLPAGPQSVVRAVCAALMVAVPAAMVGLGFHTLADVLVGGGAGLIALVASRRLAAPRPAVSG